MAVKDKLVDQAFHFWECRQAAVKLTNPSPAAPPVAVTTSRLNR